MRVLNSLLVCFATGLLLTVPVPAPAQEAQPADGIFVTVQNPITEGALAQIKAAVDSARNDPKRNIKKVIFDFNPEGKDAATENYGACADLADYIRSLATNGITPIAFVRGKTTRHSVLPAIACDELVMSSDAKIGEVWSKERPVTKNQTDNYLEKAGIPRAGPVLKMIDKDVKLVKARFKEGQIWVDPRKVDGPTKDPAYAEVRIVDPTPAPMSAGVELYGLEQAMKFNICRRNLESRADIREFYQLSASSETADPLGGNAMKAVRIMVEGQINDALREKIRRQIETAKARKENTFFFVLETSAGGDPAAAREIADDLIKLIKDPGYKARTIAFIPGNAPDLAVFIAFACGEIVMYMPDPDHTGEAVLGDFEAFLGGGPNQPRRGNPDFIRKNLADIAEQMGHPRLIVEGMFDKNLSVVQAKNETTGDKRLMSEEELNANKGWTRVPGGMGKIKEKGTYLKLNASKAKDLRMAKTVGNKDISEVYSLYGIEAKDVRESEPGWLDNFAAFLRRTEISILLVIVGIAGLVLELKAPGLIVPGVIAAVCFVLFFWAQTQLGGQLIYLAIMLFLLGLALVGIEIFLIPGFGITGVSGILLILAGLVLAGLDKAPESSADWAELIGKMLRYGLTMAGAGVLAFLLSRYLPKIPYANRLMLVPPEDKPEVEETSPLPGVDAAVTLLGQVGTATSMLRPAGLAKFGDRYIDVVTEGDFIAPGTPIQVVEVEGTRIVVKKV